MADMFVVRLRTNRSPTGQAFIGPEQCDGFKVDNIESAHRFDSLFVAVEYANHWRGQWRGFYAFDPDDMSVNNVEQFALERSAP